MRPKDAAQVRLEAKFGVRRGRPQVGAPTHYVVARRPMKWHGLELAVGEVVEDAAQWPRLEAWVRAGRIAPAYGERMETQEPVEAGEPEELDENIAAEPEDTDPTEYTGEPIPDEELEEVAK